MGSREVERVRIRRRPIIVDPSTATVEAGAAERLLRSSELPAIGPKNGLRLDLRPAGEKSRERTLVRATGTIRTLVDLP
jgi:hypothetical protein